MHPQRKIISKFPAASAALLALALAGGARAQSAGGFSAGPGLSPAATHDSDAKGDFRTDITSFKPSPNFTQVREFTTTRMWVLDPGQVTVEQWWNGSFGAPSAQPGPNQGNQFFQTEIELGVARHFQIDIYGNYQFAQDPISGNYQIARGGHTGIAAEVRYAIGDYWGQYWGNPTLYFELTSQYYNSPRAEARLLLGGNILTSKLLGALNLGFERNIFRDSGSGIDYEIKADYGINYEVIPDVLRLGVEGVLGFDSHGILDHSQGGVAIGGQSVYPVAEVGPSIVLMEPHRHIKLLASMLFGLAQYDTPWQPTAILSSAF